MGLLRRTIPVLLAFLCGVSLIIAFYIPNASSDRFQQEFYEYYLIIAGIALLLGMWSLCASHWKRIRRRQTGWGYSFVMFAGLFFTLGITFINEPGRLLRDIRHPDQRNQPYTIDPTGRYLPPETANQETAIYKWLYEYVYKPMDSTIFSLLAFFIASAAYRTFRARTVEAGLLLVAAIIVMIGRVPIGGWIASNTGVDIPAFMDWILGGPNLAAKRAILLGVSLGAVTTSLKIILGIERSYLGGSEG